MSSFDEAEEIAQLKLDLEAARVVLRRVEFGGIGHRKCPVCLGWEGGPKGRGEVEMQHTADCELAAVLKGEPPPRLRAEWRITKTPKGRVVK